MRVLYTLPALAVLGSAFVIPDVDVMSQVAIQDHRSDSFFDKLPSKEQVAQEIEAAFDVTKNAFDEVYDVLEDTANTVSTQLQAEYFDCKAWLESASEELPIPPNERKEHDGPGHKKPPHHGPPHKGPGHEKPPHHGPPHHRPGRGGRHRRHHSNLTVYELIAKSKYTTKLAALINEFDDVVELLNGTSANFTVFAPTDRAFAKIPDKAPKPSKEVLLKILSYHVSPEFFPAGRILVGGRTIPTLLEGTYLSDEPKKTAQRVSTNIGFNGLTINFFSRVVAADIFGSNGVIHGVDSILIPPPKAATIISFLPGEFSTLELALVKTGLYSVINDTSNHLGGTLFAPTNFGFKLLGPRANAFLFSKYGQKYLTALLSYHVVANKTLYSDTLYASDSSESSIPKDLIHVDLPTLLKDRSLSIDIFRFGRYTSMKINAFTTVATQNGIAKDGVLHTINGVLIPPKQVNGEMVAYEGGEIDVDDLKARLEPLVKDEKFDEEL